MNPLRLLSMKNIIPPSLLLIAFALLPTSLTAIPNKATEVNPIEVGSTVPDVALTQADGSSIQLKDLIAAKKTVIVFYRGSWCPYCTRHLAALGQVEETLVKKGYQIIAISPDQPAKVSELSGTSEFNYTLYSDSEMAASSAFGLTFKVDAPTLKKLDRHNIDIEAASGEKHHLLPVPAVFIVASDGTIQFRYYNPDYSKRLSAKKIVNAIQ